MDFNQKEQQIKELLLKLLEMHNPKVEYGEVVFKIYDNRVDRIIYANSRQDKNGE